MHKTYKIFIAEDEETLSEIYSERFAKAGFEVKSFKNGLKLLEELATDTPDVILLDLQMPELTGFDVMDALHKNFQDQDKRKVMVIVWSNSGGDDIVERTKQMGAAMFLKKVDYSGNDLVEKVRNAIETKVSLPN